MVNDERNRLGSFLVLVRCLAAMVLAIAAPMRASADAFPDSLFANSFEACSGLECAQVACAAGQTTSISGTVYAPNGSLPLPNVEVYVPNASVGALVDGPNNVRCNQAPLGHPLVATLTDANGNFTLKRMPATTNVPVVILAGKWRRQISVANVPQCTNTMLAADSTRLPRDHTEGDIAHIALVTGAGEALECLMRKTGVFDSEFTTDAGSGRIHLYAGYGATNHFDAALGSATFTASSSFWTSSTNLAAYDQVMAACGASQNPGGSEPQTGLDAMRTYADAGGRIYLSHWQNYFISAGAPPWNTVATWNFGASNLDSVTGLVNGSFVQGSVLSAWLAVVGASASPGTLPIIGGRQTAVALDETVARKWVYLDTTINNAPSFQYFTFTTPVGSAASAQNGRVLFTEMHAGANGDFSTSSTAFPSGGCLSNVADLTAQDKALLYGFFDLQRCVGSTRE